MVTLSLESGERERTILTGAQLAFSYAAQDALPREYAAHGGCASPSPSHNQDNVLRYDQQPVSQVPTSFKVTAFTNHHGCLRAWGSWHSVFQRFHPEARCTAEYVSGWGWGLLTAFPCPPDFKRQKHLSVSLQHYGHRDSFPRRFCFQRP